MRNFEISQLSDEDFWIGLTGTLFEPSSHADLEFYRGARIASFIAKLAELYMRADQAFEVRCGILDVLQDFYVADAPDLLKPVAEHALELPDPTYQAMALCMLTGDAELIAQLVNTETSTISEEKVKLALARYLSSR